MAGGARSGAGRGGVAGEARGGARGGAGRGGVGVGGRRVVRLVRKTRETEIRLRLDIDGGGEGDIRTGLPFFDHMLVLLARHALFDLTVRARGDLAVDDHHTVEDMGLVLGGALDRALGRREGIARYGFSLLPMDETLARVAVDLGGRPYLVFGMACKRRKIKEFDLGLIEEFMRAFTVEGRMNLHIAQLYGRDPHHAYEAVFKGVARALKMACRRDGRVVGVPSSKGIL